MTLSPKRSIIVTGASSGIGSAASDRRVLSFYYCAYVVILFSKPHFEANGENPVK